MSPSNKMRIRIKNGFINPLSNMRCASGDEFNVPMNQFWLRRIKQGDCEKLKKQLKPKFKKLEASKLKNNSKGSK